MRLTWSSDIHLNHASMGACDDWIEQVKRSASDGLILTGDISEADDVAFQLARIAESFNRPIYFVLGNHDFYGASIAYTRRRVTACATQVEPLCYLTEQDPIELEPGSFLTGEDGWGDAREGDFAGSPVRLADFLKIKDFRRVDPISWPRLMQEQGDESAERLGGKLDGVSGTAKQIVVATHVPPFRESCWYEGRTADDFWAPFFVCAQVGKVLRRFALRHPRIEITVLCGHTHHGGVAQIGDNLKVLTASADYGRPAIERVLEL